jgi:heme-degrading monooxygenase HmoA
MAMRGEPAETGVVEIVRVSCRPGLGDEFGERLRSAVNLIARANGCQGLSVHRGVEDPDTFILLVRWTSIAAHEGWRASDAAPRYRSELADLQAGPAQFGHYQILVART